MTFENLLEWLKTNLNEPVRFDTLGKKSQFTATFHESTSSLEIKNSKGNVGLLDKESLRKIFQRHSDAPPNKRDMTGYWTPPKWPDTPNMIFAPYVPAIIRDFLQTL